MADKVMVMDKGRLIAYDEPWNIGNFLAGDSQEERHPMFYGMPAVMKIYSHCRAKGVPRYIREDREMSPLTIRDGRLWLESFLGDGTTEISCMPKHGKEKAGGSNEKSEEEIIKIKDLWFKYGKESGDVLRGLNLSIKKGEFFCLLGGNGVGKSTTLKAVSGVVTPQHGTIVVDGLKVKKENFEELFNKRLAMLPQNPQALFTEITVEEELLEALYFEKISDEEKIDKIEKTLEMMEITHLRKSHPYDLSGGEQQRLALGKILLLDPKILLLDEPTKGLDPFFKITLAGILKKLTASGVTIFMVSHDVEFCAEYADRCAMFFDGDVVSEGTPKEFFAGNSFYTTSANRIVRRWFPEGITWEEVANWAERVTAGRSLKQEKREP